MTSRRYPDRPLVGVGAVLLRPPALDQVLLVQRAAPPGRGQWSFPGGLVETGETLRQACSREVLEETGLEVELRDVAIAIERIFRDAAGRVEYHYIIVDFWGVPTGGELRSSSDAAAVAWVDVQRLGELETTRSVPAAVERTLRIARGERGGEEREPPVLLEET